MPPPTDEPATRRGRPRDARARTAILRATAGILEAHGYGGVTMEGVATAAGVGKQTVYRWWPGKAALVGETLLEGFIEFPDVPLPATSDVWADLAVWLIAGEEGFRGHYGELLRVAAAVAAQDEVLVARMTERFSAPARATLLHRLRRAVEAGQISATADLDAITDLLQALISYAGVTRASHAMVTRAVAVIRAAAER